jgi:micrococcal nuclease
MTSHLELKRKSKLYYYAAHVTSVYDGDTITVDIDLGLGMWRRGQTIRLWKVNTPEVRGPEHEEGRRVRTFVANLVLNKTILVRTILDKRGQDHTEKFGRLLGEILVEDTDGNEINVNERLLEQGMARIVTDAGVTLPAGAAALPLPGEVSVIACPFCGEARRVDATTAMVEICPNCLDAAYHL